MISFRFEAAEFRIAVNEVSGNSFDKIISALSSLSELALLPHQAHIRATLLPANPLDHAQVSAK